MRVTVVGCSGSLPGPDSAASCYLVQADGPAAGGGSRTWSLLLDLGSGALGPLQRHTDPLALDAVLLSHLHSDHCADLSGLHVLRRHHPGGAARTPLPVWSPPGGAERLGRTHGATGPVTVTDSYTFHDLTDGAELVVGPFAVTVFAVRHPVPAFGFRLEADGAVLAYTGDTDSCPQLADLLRGADLALVDSAFVEGRDTDPGVHLSGRRAGAAVSAAGGVGRLVLTHQPPWNDGAVTLAEAAAVWPGQMELARPGARYLLGSPSLSAAPSTESTGVTPGPTATAR